MDVTIAIFAIPPSSAADSPSRVGAPAFGMGASSSVTGSLSSGYSGIKLFKIGIMLSGICPITRLLALSMRV